MAELLTLSQLAKSGQLQGKRVFIRADLNVPFDEMGRITEDTRIRASVTGIRLALDAGAAVMVTSHLGRPIEGEPTEADSLAPIARRLSELLGLSVSLVQNWLDGVRVEPGQVVLLENCRLNIGEKNNDEALAKKMAKLCDVYVNDAFGTAHRAEATTYGLAQFARIACAGPLLKAELEALGRAIYQAKRPLVALVGGSKVSTKISILNALSTQVDQLIVGGGILNTFMLAAGWRVGKSLVESQQLDQAKAVMASMKKRGAEVPLPTDVVCAKRLAADAVASIKTIDQIEKDDIILDIGPQTTQQVVNILTGAKTIVWNGPVGVFEFQQFATGTQAIAQAIAESSAFSIAGGGDTLAAIAKFDIEDKIGYISTGGGAFLEFLEGKTLPAVQILEQRAVTIK